MQEWGVQQLVNEQAGHLADDVAVQLGHHLLGRELRVGVLLLREARLSCTLVGL